MSWRSLMEESNRRDTLALLLLVIVLLLLALLFLKPYAHEFPMDDTYIHFVYAQNLAQGRGLYFSFPEEVGVGTTSILWVLLLAGGAWLGFSIGILAKIVGVLSLFVTSICIFVLLKPILRVGMAWLGAVLIAVSGNMLWFALSGMETMLFVALGLLALLEYRKKRWVSLGILLGLLALTRPEGVLLAAALAVLESVRSRGLTRSIIVSGALCLLIAGPWYVYLFSRTGHFLPTSAVGKQLTYQIGLRYVFESRPGMAWLEILTPLVYLGSWIAYLLEFTLGGMALPAPRIPIASLGQNLTYSLSIWALPVWVMIIILLVIASRRLIKPARWRSWFEITERQPWMIFIVWVLIHNFVYMVWIPVPGTASRYGAINHVVLWVGIVFGLAFLLHDKRRFAGMLGGVILIAGINTAYWDQVYQANLEHMREVRIKAALHIKQSFRQDELCAASDVGAIRYFSQRPIIDLGALVNPDAGRVFQEGEVADYLISSGARCLVVPGRMQRSDEGWFDILTIMGLTTTSKLKLTPLKVYEIEPERWLLGYLPTSNYQASVVIYQLDPGPEIEENLP